MRPLVLKRRRRRRGALAAALAVGAHLLFLLALGWRIPAITPLQTRDTRPPVEVQLLRRLPARSAPPSAPSSPTVHATHSLVRASPAEPSVPSAPVAAPPTPEVAAGAPDCAPEDLPLLTEAEKARCRNQIDADRERRLARGADERAAKQVAEARRGPQTFRMPAAKEAYYGAVAQVYEQQSRGPRGAGRRPGFTCKAGGAKAKGGPGTLALGPCVFSPGQGFLTEETEVPAP